MKKYGYLLFFICFGCAQKPARQPLQISVIGKNTVRLNNLGDKLLINLKQGSVAQSQWQSLIPIYRMPADSDMKDYQQPQPGSYAFKNGVIVFTADTPFVKRGKYFIRVYQMERDNSSWAVIKGNWKPNAIPYIEYSFTP